MTIPDGARFECELAGGIVLLDVAELLPSRLEPYMWQGRPRYPYPERTEPARHLVVHHSGAYGRNGFEGLEASARYVYDHLGYPGHAYHIWAPRKHERDPQGRIVVYRANPDDHIAWATGGMNEISLALCLQGNTNNDPPSADQVEILEAIIPWAVERYGLQLPDGLTWHSEADRWGGRKKPSCPGRWLEEWLVAYRQTA